MVYEEEDQVNASRGHSNQRFQNEGQVNSIEMVRGQANNIGPCRHSHQPSPNDLGSQVDDLSKRCLQDGQVARIIGSNVSNEIEKNESIDNERGGQRPSLQGLAQITRDRMKVRCLSSSRRESAQQSDKNTSALEQVTNNQAKNLAINSRNVELRESEIELRKNEVQLRENEVAMKQSELKLKQTQVDLDGKRFSLEAQRVAAQQINDEIEKNLKLLTETTKLLGTFLSNGMKDEADAQIREIENLRKKIQELQNKRPTMDNL